MNGAVLLKYCSVNTCWYDEFQNLVSSAAFEVKYCSVNTCWYDEFQNLVSSAAFEVKYCSVNTCWYDEFQNCVFFSWRGRPQATEPWKHTSQKVSLFVILQFLSVHASTLIILWFISVSAATWVGESHQRDSKACSLSCSLYLIQVSTATRVGESHQQDSKVCSLSCSLYLIHVSTATRVGDLQHCELIMFPWVQCYWAIQWSWFARVNALCNLSRKKSREVAAHFRADFWVGVASRWKLNLESRSSTNANTVAVAKITLGRGWRVEKKVSLRRFLAEQKIASL